MGDDVIDPRLGEMRDQIRRKYAAIESIAAFAGVEREDGERDGDFFERVLGNLREQQDGYLDELESTRTLLVSIQKSLGLGAGDSYIGPVTLASILAAVLKKSPASRAAGGRP